MRSSHSPTVVRRRHSLRPSILVPRDVEAPSRFVEDTIVNNLARLLQISPSSLDPKESFIGLGGHSLLAVELSNACKSSHINLSLTDILLSESITKMCASATRLEPSSPASPIFPTTRRGSIQALSFDSYSVQTSTSRSSRRSSLTPISPTVVLRPWADTHSRRPSIDNQINADSLRERPTEQQGHHRKESASSNMTEMQLSLVHGYEKNPGTNVINFFETYNNEDIPAVRTAWRVVIEGESIFHQGFDVKGSDHTSQQHPFRWNEIVCASKEHFELELKSQKTPKTIESAFDCVTYPEARTSTVVWRVHHAYVDGMAGQLLYKKMRTALGGGSPTPGTIFSSVVLQLKAFQQTNREHHQRFWREQTQKHPQPAGDLSLPEPSSSVSSAAIEEVSFDVPLAKVTTASRQTGVSLAAWFQAAWAMTLSLYTDSSSVVFGTILAGRNLPLKGAHDTIGPLVNTLPFNISIDPNQSASHFLRSVFEHSVALQDVQCSMPEDGFSRNFASAMAMEFEFEPEQSGSCQPVGASYFRIIPDIPLSLYMSSTSTLRLCYKPSRYLEKDVQTLASHFRRAILLLLKSDSRMSDIMSRLLTRECKETLRSYGNCHTDDTSLVFIKDDLVTLFERAARENPSAVAVEKADTLLTYAELDRLASMLAKKLQVQGVLPGDVICVHADRSINWIIAIYGILKIGAVYSAQDAALPAHIREMNFKTAGAKVFLTPLRGQKGIAPESCGMCLSVEELIVDTCEGSHVGLPHRVTPQIQDNAYLCFTSGSTGKPKGCMCHHAGLVAFQKDPEVRFFAAPGQRIAQVMSPAFDGSIHEIFSALSYGATLVLTNGVDPFVHIKKSTACLLTPSVAKILDPQNFPDLKTLYVVGEPVPQYVNDLWSKHVNMYNMYGPTEATCGATIQKLSPGRKVTIGPPNSTTRVYILDRNQQRLPPGVIGEIYCAGVQVACGYVGRPDLTAKRFLPDTVEKRPGEKMYRTGDRGFFNHNGEVECLGRNDRQIKLRGYRVDLNDIEMRVAQGIPESTAVAVCQKDDYLVAMIQPETLDMSDIRTRLMKTVPVHAVPRIVQAVDKFPFTPAGKIDYRKIAEACTTARPAPALAQMTITEAQITQVWKDLLVLPETEKLSGNSNFTDLGGHSVLQLRLANRLSSKFKRKIPMASIIATSTLSEMARVVDKIAGKDTAAADAGLQPLGLANVSPIEADWVRKYDLKRGTSAFNVTFAASIDAARVDVEHLISCWNAVLARHQIFRSRYHLDGRQTHEVRRQYSKYCPQVVRPEDNNLDLWKEVNRPFHLDRQNPIRVFVNETRMLVSMSHIIADLTTLQVLLKEVTHLYNEQALPRVQRRYADTVQWAAPVTPAQKQWWQQYLSGCNTSQHLISRLPKRSTYGGSTRLTKLPGSMMKRVLDYATQEKLTLHQLGLAAVSLALQTDSEDVDVVLGGPYFNRGADDVETVGLFLEPIPIRIQHSSEKGSFVQSVQSSSQAAIANAIPWHQILKAVGAEECCFPNQPLTDVMVTFHDNRSASLLPIDGIDPLVTYTKGSKFTLLVEFNAVSDDTIVLRLEYDDTLISNDAIRCIRVLIEEALESIVSGVSFEEAKRRLKAVASREMRESSAADSYFGKGFAAMTR